MNNKLITNHLTNHYSDHVFSFIKRYADELNTNQNILDVGCGHCRNLRLFQELGFNKLFGIDRNKTNNPLGVNFKFQLGDIQKGISYDDRSFDIVLCNHVLMFIKKDKIDYVLEEVLRVCNGYLVLETYPKKSSGVFYEDYSFKYIADYIESNTDFEVLQRRNYYEKLITRRKDYGKRKKATNG